MLPNELSENYPLTFKMLSNVESPMVAEWIEDELATSAIGIEGQSPRFNFAVNGGEFIKDRWDSMEKFLGDYEKMDSHQKMLCHVAHPFFSMQKRHEWNFMLGHSEMKEGAASILNALKEMGPDHIPA